MSEESEAGQHIKYDDQISIDKKSKKLQLSEHCKKISKVALSLITELQQEKPLIKIDHQRKQTSKHITTKYLQTVKRLTSSLKNTAGKISFLKCTQREKINKQTISSEIPVSLKEKLSKCKKNTAVINTRNKTSNDSNLHSPIRNFIRIHRRERCKINGKNTAIDILLKLKLSLKAYITAFIMKSQTSNKLKRCNHMCYEQQPVIFNYIFPYRCSSSESIEENDEQSENSYELNDRSTIILTSDSSTESFSDSQETRHQAQIRISVPIVDVAPCVRNISMYNNYNTYRSDDVLIRHLNLDTKMNGIKTLRRVTLKRHHKRVTSKLYRQSFNKKYQTYFAEISYINQVLDLSPACRQGVGIGSSWDVNIDFGRSTTQNLSAHGGVTPSLGQVDGIKTGAGHILPQYQCPPGVCTTSKCNPKKCYKRLKKSLPYGSHASSQARKYKFRDLRTLRKRSNGKHIGVGRGAKRVNDHISLSSRGQPHRQKIRIGSKTGFNVQFYKESPVGARSINRASNRDSGNKKHNRARRKHKALKTLECPPGICDPRNCKSRDCYQRLKAAHIGIITDPYLLSSSHGGSQVGTQSRKIKGRHLRAGRETFYKEKGTLSVPRPKMQLNMPNRQAVRIGSKCSFNIEFYRSMPRNDFVPNEYDQGDTSGREKADSKRKSIKKYQCEPGVCIPGQCNANTCFQQLKSIHSQASLTGSSKGTSQGSQASTKKKRLEMENATFYKDKGVSSMPRPKTSLHIPNRQAVRIGSKCSFNIEFYRSMPYNRFGMNEYNQGDSGKTHKPSFQCEPGACIPGKCNTNDCFQILKAKHKTSGVDSSLTGSMSQGSQASINTRKKRQALKAEKATFNKDKGVSSMPRPKTSLHIPNRQAVRIGSKCSFNIEFYRSMPYNRFGMNEYNQGDRGKTHKPSFQCEPGACIPGKCNTSDCFQILKAKHKTSGVDSSLTGSMSQGSQASINTRKKRQALKAERATFNKDKGVSSMPRPKTSLHIPNRQAVRIGSKCSFNIEFYRSMPYNRFGMNEYKQGDSGKTHKPSFQCEPGACIPGKCNTNDCFQILKAKHNTSGVDSSLTGSMSQGSQASNNSRKNRKALKAEKATINKDKGVSSMPRPKTSLHIPNRQAVRIGSKCSFNIEFYRSMPCNGFGMNEYNQGDSGKIPKPRLQCEPGVCIPGKCNANDCFLTLKAKTRLSGSSLTGSSNVLSQSSQAATKWRKNKNRQLQPEKATYYRDKGVASRSIPKNPCKPHRQAVRIASKCSFNIEFYKSMPQNDFMRRDPSGIFLPNSHHQGDIYSPPPHKAGTGNKIISRNQYECEPGICTPGKCNAIECLKLSPNKLECKPKTCVPGKCDPRVCYKRIKSTPTSIATDTSYTGSSVGSNPVATQSLKLKGRQLRAGKEKIFKEKGMSSIPRHKQTLHLPNRQAVRIGSNCSFNIEFYKAMPHKSPVMSGQSYEPVVNLPNNLNTGSNQNQIRGYQYSERYNQGDIPVQFKAATERKRRTSNMLQCHPGVCIPGKCDSRECYQRLTGTNIISGTEGSFTDSSYATSRGSQFSTKKRKNKRPELSAGNATFYRDRGASSMIKSKTPMHKLNRQAVRIGSTCSFNIDFYKNLPHAPGKDMPHFKQPHAEQIQSRQYPEQYYLSSTETDGDQSVRAIQQIAGKKFKTKKGKTKEVKTKEIKTKEVKTKEVKTKEVKTKDKKITKGQYKQGDGTDRTVQQRRQSPAPDHKDRTRRQKNDQGDATVQKKRKSSRQLEKPPLPPPPTHQPTEKRKGTKGKTMQTKKSLPKTINNLKENEQGDAITEVTPKTEKKPKKSKEKTTQKRKSPILQDQGDTTVQSDAGTDIKTKGSKEKTKRIRQSVSIDRISDQGEKGFEYELSVCIPNKCDPYLCFERLRNKDEGTTTDASLTTSSKRLKTTRSSSGMSKSTSANLDKGEEAERRKQARALPVFKNKGTSKITIDKNKDNIDMIQPMATLQTPGQNKNIKNVVRIGSSCSFNIQIYKEKPLTPSEVNTIRSATISSQDSIEREVKKQRRGFIPSLKRCCCKLIGPPMQTTSQDSREREVKKQRRGCISSLKRCCCKLIGPPLQTTTNCCTIARCSQTKQGLECMPGLCNFDCPAKMKLIDAGIGTQLGPKCAVPCCSVNAATQSRRYPLLQQVARYEKSLSSALCKCCGNLAPSKATTGFRNMPFYNNYMPLGPNMGYGDNFNGCQPCQIREQAIVIGSGCGFNVNFFKKPKK